jgi:flagellar basal-body rod modification protein FlgD
MQNIQQIITGAPQLANSATSVAGGLARPRVATSAPSTGGTDNTSSAAAASSSTITANDFLTLLVAEMKNQDPTQPTDPNAYISQMVDVNSLQQLIGINQGITSLDTSVSAGTTTSPVSGASS